MKVNNGALKDGGISRGFIIQRINDNNITSLDDLQKAVKSASTSKEYQVIVCQYLKECILSGRHAKQNTMKKGGSQN